MHFTKCNISFLATTLAARASFFSTNEFGNAPINKTLVKQQNNRIAGSRSKLYSSVYEACATFVGLF